MDSGLNTESRINIGYIVIKEKEHQGYVGGCLCTDERGVPREFWHSTDSPVKADNIQKILYGKALKPELFGKHIAGALLSKIAEDPKCRPSVFITQEEAVLQGLDHRDAPVLCIDLNPGGSHLHQKHFVEKNVLTGTGKISMKWRTEEAEKVEDLIPELEGVDLLEPFERIDRLLNELSGKGYEKLEE